MTERPSDADKATIPKDIATLYSRAQMQQTRYWDFSASRNEVRGQFHHRIVREPVERAVEVAPPTRPLQMAPPPREPQLRTGPFRVPEAPTRPETQPDSRPSPAFPDSPDSPNSNVPRPTRWHALHSVFQPAERIPEAAPISAEQRPPILALFSLAGGVGKTCLTATLGRALSALGEHVLLVDTATCGLLPFYFSARDFKPGLVRTFSRPGAEDDVPVNVLNLQQDRYPGSSERDPLLDELLRGGRGAVRILVDIATASGEVTSRLMQLGPTFLVPILPDMSSLACVAPLETMLAGADTFYLLNQFDPALPLHLDMQETLRQQLGDRLLPFALRRSFAVSEALAEGMTVIDYAPGSAAAEDYWSLAAWLRNFAAPALVSYGGVRWSER
jgi:cellulose synthase operon protein YhjQ